MASFLKSLGNKAWKVVIRKHHMITSEDDTTSLKPEVDWTNVKDNEAIGNSKALNAVFNSVCRTLNFVHPSYIF